MPDERLLMLVEDDEGFARTLKRSFERRGYAVLLAEGFDRMMANEARFRIVLTTGA